MSIKIYNTPFNQLLMKSQTHSSFSPLHLFLTLSILFFQTLNGLNQFQPKQPYQRCGKNFSCGNLITGIGYPFRGSNDPRYCGHPSLVLDCETETNMTTIDIMSTKYRVLEINQSTCSMRVSRKDVMDTNSSCPREKTNTTLDYSVFDYAPGYTNVTFFYGCSDRNRSGFQNVSCGNSVYDEDVYVLPGIYGPGKCEASVVVPVPEIGILGDSVDTTGLGQVLRDGFWISLKLDDDEEDCNECVMSKGRCGYDVLMNRTACYCPDPPYFSNTVCSMASGASPDNTPSHSGTHSGTYIYCFFNRSSGIYWRMEMVFDSRFINQIQIPPQIIYRYHEHVVL
ncbi:hypothetical protein CASFOL_015385 [Castilleja foliolosa]|uniref:non-specific serine/threonine protein kinase n=1 Tax=Castilleja foliolosa TaxID=1961234 RepID=A0ABD3DFE0_9LAMI